MQKISSYLYPNRILVVVDLASHITEYRIVYQRRLKIYQGLDNVIEFDFKNAQQRRIDISGLTIKCVITEQTNQEICTVDVVPVIDKPGIATVTIPSNVLTSLLPQYLKYSLYIVNSDTILTPIYADTQFGAIGNMELLDGVFPKTPKPQVIDTFLFRVNDNNPNAVSRTYISESVEVKPLNDINDTTTIGLDFALAALDGNIDVQLSNDQVISNGSVWRTVESFAVTSATTSLTKTYHEVTDYTNNVGWLRVTYTPDLNTTGKIDRITVRM